MSVFAKLNQARIRLLNTSIKKNGENKFAGFKYFELADFIPHVLNIFNDIGLVGIVSFGKEEATLRIVDVESGSEIVFSSPMSEASLKGVHAVQNLGAVQTYIRRYLWVTAMEIVEHDALDATTGQEGKGKGSIAPTDGALDHLSADQLISVTDDAKFIVDSWNNGDKLASYDAYMSLREGDQEYLTAVWHVLKPHSAIRNGLKKMYQEAQNGKA